MQRLQLPNLLCVLKLILLIKIGEKKIGETLNGDYYDKVQYAIQGHPELSRLCQLFIDDILSLIGF